MSPDEALAPILRAGRLSRYRLLDVACATDHRVMQVIGTPPGAVVVYTPMLGAAGRTRMRPAGAVTQVEWLTSDGEYEALCHCGPHTITSAWLHRQMDAGRRRTVLA